MTCGNVKSKSDFYYNYCQVEQWSNLSWMLLTPNYILRVIRVEYKLNYMRGKSLPIRFSARRPSIDFFASVGEI